MARIVHGPNIGAVSGAVGNQVSSKGRYGAHITMRRKPCSRTTASTVASRTRFAEVSRAWGGLQPEEKAAWGTWAQSNPVRDRLGQEIVLAAPGAFCELNGRLVACGRSMITLPPAVAAPVAHTVDRIITSFPVGDVILDMDAGFPALGLDVMVWACAQVKGGRRRWQDALKLVHVVAAGTAGDVNIASAMCSRFGTLYLGQSYWILCVVCDPLTGLLGVPELFSGLF